VAGGGRKAILLAVVATLGVSLSTAAAGAAQQATLAANQAWLVQGVNPSSTYNVLNGVSADSATDAWAVGSYHTTAGVDDTLIEQWNGTAWTQVPSPSPGTGNVLTAVSADSPTDAWAVGSYHTTSGYDTLILRWNGTAWTQVPSPNPSGFPDNELYGVSALSGTDAWAVGYSEIRSTGQYHTLILKWNGTAWTRVPSPNPSSIDSELYGVSTVSATDAWAAGCYLNKHADASDPLTVKWNGTAWTHVPSPNPSAPGNPTTLSGVSAVSGTAAWAVGSYDATFTGGPQALLLRWNGKAWGQAPDAASSLTNVNQPLVTAVLLDGVSAISATDAWAVGFDLEEAPKRTPAATLTLHRNGKRWSAVDSPNPGAGNNVLNGASTVSATDAWAVGYYTQKSVHDTLILHWNGKTWSQT